MQHYVDCPKIQQLALHTLMNATHQHLKLCTCLPQVTCKRFVASMKMHSSHESIQFLGLHTLINLCHFQQHSVYVVDVLHGISLVLTILTRFSNNYTLVEASCDLMYRLGCVERIRQRLLASHVLLALATAVEALPSRDGNRARMAALDALNLLTTKR